jgi:hypothetical protein
MAEKLIEGTKTGETFASLTPEALALLETFKVLDESAREKAKDVTPACEALDTAWDALLPILDEMQSLLSQRGEKREVLREVKLPGWEKWWASFKKQTGLDATLRNVQIRLRKYRGLEKPADKVKPERTSPPAQWSYRDRVRMLKAVQIGCELANAVEVGGDPNVPLHEFQNLRIDREYIERQLESIQDLAETVESSFTPTAPAAAAPTSVAVASVISPEPVKPVPPLLMPKPGDGISLSRFINEACGRYIGAAIEGDDPSTMANVFDKCVDQLVKLNCHYDRMAGEIRVSIKYVRYQMPVVDQAA